MALRLGSRNSRGRRNGSQTQVGSLEVAFGNPLASNRIASACFALLEEFQDRAFFLVGLAFFLVGLAFFLVGQPHGPSSALRSSSIRKRFSLVGPPDGLVGHPHGLGRPCVLPGCAGVFP